jgi:hypothetical protein
LDTKKAGSSGCPSRRHLVWIVVTVNSPSSVEVEEANCPVQFLDRD